MASTMIDRAAVIRKLDMLIEEMENKSMSLRRLDASAYVTHPLGRTTELKYARKATYWSSMLEEMLFIMRRLKSSVGGIEQVDSMTKIREAAEQVTGLVNNDVPLEDSIIQLLNTISRKQSRGKKGAKKDE